MPKPNSRVFLLFILLCFTLVTELHAQRTQIIKAVEGLQFNPVRLHVKAGQDMVIKFQNDDPSDMPHNFVLIKPSNLQKIQKRSKTNKEERLDSTIEDVIQTRIKL